MSKSDPSSLKKERNKTIRWVVTIFFTTMLISGLITMISDELMAVSSIAVAFLILLVIVAIGIVFDVVGMAVASADAKPFHSMAARKVAGATEAIKLLNNADRVTSICNDVVGDICGVVAGSASATVAAALIQRFEFGWPGVISLALSAIVAGLTVGGKAIGKVYAVRKSTEIVHSVGRFLRFLSDIPKIFTQKKSK